MSILPVWGRRGKDRFDGHSLFSSLVNLGMFRFQCPRYGGCACEVCFFYRILWSVDLGSASVMLFRECTCLEWKDRNSWIRARRISRWPTWYEARRYLWTVTDSQD